MELALAGWVNATRPTEAGKLAPGERNVAAPAMARAHVGEVGQDGGKLAAQPFGGTRQRDRMQRRAAAGDDAFAIG